MVKSVNDTSPIVDTGNAIREDAVWNSIYDTSDNKMVASSKSKTCYVKAGNTTLYIENVQFRLLND